MDHATVVNLGAPSRCDVYNSNDGTGLGPLYNVLGKLVTTGVLSDLDKSGVPASSTLNTTASPRTKWDYTPADCATKNGEDVAGPNAGPLVGGTSVKCDGDDEIAATAESRAKEIPELEVTVAKAKATTKIKRDKDKGLITTATSRL